MRSKGSNGAGVLFAGELGQFQPVIPATGWQSHLETANRRAGEMRGVVNAAGWIGAACFSEAGQE